MRRHPPHHLNPARANHPAGRTLKRALAVQVTTATPSRASRSICRKGAHYLLFWPGSLEENFPLPSWKACENSVTQKAEISMILVA